jgi:hypothetical protein
MFRASLYIIVCSARNRLRVRLRRLREPRYLIGAIVGGAYIYFSFFARFRASRASAARRNARQAQLPASMAALMASGPALAGLALMAVAALSWIMPFDSGLLSFSDVEIQFLFPAPVSRRQLLIYRMLRSQLGMLFGAVVIGLASPSAFGFSRLRISVGAGCCRDRDHFTASRSPGWLSRDTRRLGVAWLPIGS